MSDLYVIRYRVEPNVAGEEVYLKATGYSSSNLQQAKVFHNVEEAASAARRYATVGEGSRHLPAEVVVVAVDNPCPPPLKIIRSI